MSYVAQASLPAKILIQNQKIQAGIKKTQVDSEDTDANKENTDVDSESTDVDSEGTDVNKEDIDVDSEDTDRDVCATYIYKYMMIDRTMMPEYTRKITG